MFRFILSFKASILPNTLNMFGAHCVGESLKPKEVPREGTHRNGHPSLYESNHRDDHISYLPLIKPFPLGSIPNAHVGGNVVLSPKILHPLLGVN